MNFREVPFGNGQEVYIEPEWLEKDYRDYMPDHDKYIVEQLVEYLCRCGYIITSDSATVSDNAFFFNPCLDKHINASREDFVGKKEAMITECLSNESVKAPYTIPFKEDQFFNITPGDLPIIIKNEYEQGGTDKYIIRTSEQLETFKMFYNEINAYDKKRRESVLRKRLGLGEEATWDETGHSKETPWCIFIMDYKRNLHENFVIQKFIQTPTKYNTSLRVITSSSGDILCSSLKYADKSIEKNKTFCGPYDQYLKDPSSPYYLGSESIISNTVSGGNSLLLGRNDYSKLEQEILRAHGIDPNNANVPQTVASAARKIAITSRRPIGAISGMDFIFDEETQEWKYLEQHEYPMLGTYAEAYGLPYTSIEDPNYFTIHFAVDIDARLHSLALAMQKKQAMNNEEGQSLRHN